MSDLDFEVVKSNASSDSFAVTKLTTNERLNSTNIGNWDPDVRLLQSSDKWIGVYGLKKLKLELQQILPTIGFKHSDDFVKSLKKPISARYSKGLFTRVPFKDGSVYNLVATRDKLKNIEKQLNQAIMLYKKRLEWLTSESRRIFGVIEEKSICIILDIQSNSDMQFNMYIQSLVQVIKEQIMFLSKFNLIRVAVDAECWQERSVCVTRESIDDALDWLLGQPMKTEVSATSLTEAILRSMSEKDVEAVYLFTEGNASNTSRELFKRKLKECGKQLNVVSFNCSDPSTISFLKTVSKIGGGRFHAFSMFHEYGSNGMLTQGEHVENSDGSPSKSKGPPAAKIGYGLRQDVMKIWEELDQSRNTLAEIQALLVEFENPQKAMKAIADAKPQKLEPERKEGRGELYMGSKQWLNRHGLKAKKLSFYDFLQTLAFRHCDGVVDIQHPPKRDHGNAVVKQKLINARYCDRFAHVRWKDGELMHIHISGPMHRNYEERILAAIESYRKRMEWLQQGSRELFGTIIEDQIVILIDTSSSMASRLFLVKDKMHKLMQEQLRHKRKFNIIKFDSRVQPWREHVVDCNSHNLENAWLWVKGLSAGGSTNTLGALKRALADTQVEAVYLLTDGRPDQPPATVLAQSNLLNTLPVHTISFNCADTEANEFLSQLAAETGGRFHYFSDEEYNADGPKPFESEDLKLLKEEIERGLSDLQKVNSLRDECTRLDWYGPEKDRYSKYQRNRDPSTTERPASALASTSPARSIVASPLGVRPRPMSAKASSRARSAKSSGTNREKIHTTPVAPNRASQLRQNSLRKSEERDDWMLKETRDYLQGSRRPTNTTPKGPKKKTKPRSRTPGSSMLRWIKRNDLVAKKMTILDALAPAMIPHTTKYVPILDKHVLSKVFDQVLPLAHTSGRDRSEVQIINPQASNLAGYEEKLTAMIAEYRRKMDQYIFPVLSTEERLRYSSEGVPSFSENRGSMLEDLGRNDWPIEREIIEKYENEIKQAEIFLSQSKELRETSEKLSKEAAEKQKTLRIEADRKTLPNNKAAPRIKSTSKLQPSSSTRHLRNQRVVARSALDGFYYHGIVAKCLNSRYLEVDFDSGEKQVTSVRYVIPIGGARPCPTLKAGDYALVRSKLPVEEDDDHLPECDICFVPGIVQVTPLRQKSASKCYTVMRFNGTKVTVLRNDLIKITRSRFIFSCRFIRDAQLASYKRSSPVVLYPLPDKEDEKDDDKNEDSREASRASSVASSHHSVSSSASSALSNSSSLKSIKSNSSRKSSVSSHSSSSSHSSKSSSRNSSKNSSPLSTPRGTPRSQSPDVEETAEVVPTPEPEELVKTLMDEFKKSMEEKYEKQLSDLDCERERLSELQKTLTAQQQEQQDEHKRQQHELQEQQKRLQEKQQELFQKQLEQQQDDQKKLNEEQLKLQKQQDDLLKKQKSQQEQLLQAQLNQAQLINLRHQQLAAAKKKTMEQGVETEKNGIDRETATEFENEDKHTETERSFSRDSTTSPMPSRNNSISEDDEQEVSKDEVDDAVESETQPPLPEMKMFIGDDSEAVLLTSGNHGLLVSRKPPEEDPAVIAQDLPRPIKEGEEVLARWSDDGWYYRGTIKQNCGDSTYYVEDSVGNVERIIRQDIISDEDDASNVVNVGSPVVSLHPSYPYSYAPGMVLRKQNHSMFTVRFYDEQEGVVPREEMYLLPHEKFEKDCAYILACEEGLVGQAVVARNDADGSFHLGAVRERVPGARNYLIEWADQTLQVQNYAFIFGAHTKRHHLNIGDFILAIADAGSYAYLPGAIVGKEEEKIAVKFCNDVLVKNVDPLQTFWISPDYYERASEYYQNMNAASIIRQDGIKEKNEERET